MGHSPRVGSSWQALQSSLIFFPSSIKACLASGSILPFIDLGPRRSKIPHQQVNFHGGIRLRRMKASNPSKRCQATMITSSSAMMNERHHERPFSEKNIFLVNIISVHTSSTPLDRAAFLRTPHARTHPQIGGLHRGPLFGQRLCMFVPLFGQLPQFRAQLHARGRLADRCQLHWWSGWLRCGVKPPHARG